MQILLERENLSQYFLFFVKQFVVQLCKQALDERVYLFIGEKRKFREMILKEKNANISLFNSSLKASIDLPQKNYSMDYLKYLFKE